MEEVECGEIELRALAAAAAAAVLPVVVVDDVMMTGPELVVTLSILFSYSPA